MKPPHLPDVPAVAVRMPTEDFHTRLLHPSLASSQLVLRPLLPSDLPAVQALCMQSFPITYPASWYEEVVSGQLISLGLFEGRALAAIMVAETKPMLHCNPEDRDLLADPHSHVVYLLSLAVASPFRRLGLATRLLQHLLDSVVANPPYPKAVFLHVLSTNYAAINFYKRNGFVHHDTLINYYRIGESYGDGLSYVLYTNGARPPLTFGDVCRSLTTALCFPLKALLKLAVYVYA